MISKLFFIVVIFSIIAFSCASLKKAGSNDFFYCDYVGQTINDNQYFEKIVNSPTSPNLLVDTLVSEIIGLSFPYKGFRLIEDKSGNVEVAKTIIDRKKGFRYIIYNKTKLQNIDLQNPENVAARLGVLAHEIGHLTYGHGESNHEYELLADRYAGWVLKKLEVSRGNCIKALEDYIPQEAVNGSRTHPPKSRRIEAMILGWDMAQTETKTRKYFDARLIFYVESPSNPQKISGNLSLLVGTEIKTIALKNQSTALFQGIPDEMEGKDMKLSLEDSKYVIDDLNLKNLKFKENETMLIKIVYGKTYAKPEEAKFDLNFKEGSTMNYGQQPNDKILTIVLSAFSHTDYVIPIDRTAKLLLQDGATYIMELKNQDNIYLTPHEFNDIYFEGIIPKTILSRMISGSAGMITIKYDNLYIKSDSTWTTNFLFSEETIKEW